MEDSPVSLSGTTLDEWGRYHGLSPSQGFKIRQRMLSATSYDILGSGLPAGLLLVFDTKRRVLDTWTRPGHFFWTLKSKAQKLIGTVEERGELIAPDVQRRTLTLSGPSGALLASLLVTTAPVHATQLLDETDTWMTGWDGKPLTLHRVRDTTPPTPRVVSFSRADLVPRVKVEIFDGEQHLTATGSNVDIRTTNDRWIVSFLASSSPEVYSFTHMILIFCAWWSRLS